MVRFFNALGSPLLSFCQYLGELVLLATDTFRCIFTHKLRWKLFLNQVVEVGLLSQLVVVITGGFTGAVFTAQTFFQFNKLGMGSAGYLVAIFLLDINGTYYMANMVRWTRSRDIIMGLSKAFCFGILIVFISCQKGLTTREGAVGVGRATTEAVVNASLAVLICNFFLTMMFNIIYPAGYQ